MIQVIAAALTLYQIRGNQLPRFGYATFGLTVTPYRIMPFMNALADLLIPLYPTCYLVRSKEMDEAEGRTNCFIEGVAGSLVSQEQSSRTKDPANPDTYWRLWKVVSYDAGDESWLLKHLTTESADPTSTQTDKVIRRVVKIKQAWIHNIQKESLNPGRHNLSENQQPTPFKRVTHDRSVIHPFHLLHALPCPGRMDNHRRYVKQIQSCRKHTRTEGMDCGLGRCRGSRGAFC